MCNKLTASQRQNQGTSFHEAGLHIKERKAAWQTSHKEQQKRKRKIYRDKREINHDKKLIKGRKLNWSIPSEKEDVWKILAKKKKHMPAEKKIESIAGAGLAHDPKQRYKKENLEQDWDTFLSLAKWTKIRSTWPEFGKKRRT